MITFNEFFQLLILLSLQQVVPLITVNIRGVTKRRGNRRFKNTGIAFLSDVCKVKY